MGMLVLFLELFFTYKIQEFVIIKPVFDTFDMSSKGAKIDNFLEKQTKNALKKFYDITKKDKSVSNDSKSPMDTSKLGGNFFKSNNNPLEFQSLENFISEDSYNTINVPGIFDYSVFFNQKKKVSKTEDLEWNKMESKQKNEMLKLLLMAQNNYSGRDEPSLIEKIGYNLPGLRTLVYNFQNSVVISFKGTSIELGGATTENDKLNVILMFSCCNNKYSFLESCLTSAGCSFSCMKLVDKDVGYFKHAEKIFKRVKDKYKKPVILTGHS